MSDWDKVQKLGWWIEWLSGAFMWAQILDTMYIQIQKLPIEERAEAKQGMDDLELMLSSCVMHLVWERYELDTRW